MKILKLLFAVAIINMITASCNSCETSKKDEVQDESAVEMTDEGSEAMEATGGEEESTEAAAGAAGAAAHEAVEAVEGATTGVEEVPIDPSIMAESMTNTPVVYPGCEGGTADEIRECSMSKFKAFLIDNFNHEKTKQLNMAPGDYQIRSILKVDEQGKVSVIRTAAPRDELKVEMQRVIDKAPQVTPATHDGQPVSAHFMLPLDFKVQ